MTDFMFKTIVKDIEDFKKLAIKNPHKAMLDRDWQAPWKMFNSILVPKLAETKVIHYTNQIKMNGEKLVNMYIDREKTIDIAEMPFDTCFFESACKNGVVNFSSNDVSERTGKFLPTLAYWLHRMDDKIIGLQIHGDPNGSGMICGISDIVMKIEPTEPEFKLTEDSIKADAKGRAGLLIYILCEPLTRGFMTDTTGFNVKYRDEHRKKKFVHVNEVVVVDPSQQVVSTRSGDTALDYSHRFWVRGHWRKIPGRTGTDSRGNPIDGLTWVKSYIKGPDDKPLINRKWVIE